MPGDRLFRQDRRSAANLLRASFAGWHDRAIATLFLLIAVMCLRAWFVGQPPSIALVAVAASGLGGGVAVGRSLHLRLAFHACDGILAADALSADPRRQYLVRWHGVALLPIFLVLLIARPALSPAAIPAYAIGAGLTAIVARIPAGRWRRWRPARPVRAMAGRPFVGIGLAIGVLIAVSILRPSDPMTHRAAAAMLTVIAMGALTRVDDTVVRFLTASGYGTGRIVVHQMRSATGFAIVMTGGSAILFDMATVAVVGGCGLAVAGLQLLRILAYRLHRRRFADIVVAIVAGLILTTGFTFPVALPIVAGAILWQMQRRAARRTWLLP